jgi:hypothetical protein
MRRNRDESGNEAAPYPSPFVACGFRDSVELMSRPVSLRPIYALERKIDLWQPFQQSRAQLSREHWDRFSADCDNGPIAKTGVIWQPIRQDWADRLFALFEGAKPERLLRGDYSDGYMATLDDSIINYLNMVNNYRMVTPELLRAIQEFLGEQSAQLTGWLQHPWRVCSVRQFDLRPTTEIGSRHIDGWPPAIRKVFILPRGAGSQTGTTWFRLRDGSELLFDCSSPCWIVFENNVVQHAMMPGQGFRPTIELDVTPAREMSTVPVYAGLNGWYPWFPENEVRGHLLSAVAATRSLRQTKRIPV